MSEAVSRCVGILAQIQQQLLLLPEIKKFTLDRCAIPAPSLRFPQPILLQDLLDARHTHYLVPSLRQSLLNCFQFPDPFPPRRVLTPIPSPPRNNSSGSPGIDAARCLVSTL